MNNMEEIKFRYVYKSKELGNYEFDFLSIEEIESGKFRKRGLFYFLLSRNRFTGLRDVNGKDIYEGDIVEMKNWEPKKYQIIFKQGAFCLANNENEFRGDIHYIHHANTPQAKIVGNIFENQDFLERGR